MGFLTGSSSNKKAQQSAQQGFNYLKGSPVGTTYLPNGGTSNQAQADLLGVGGDPAKQQAAFSNYLNSTGYKFQQKAGSDAVIGNAASKGLINSGATLKALQERGQNLGASSFQNYFSNLGGLSNQGLQAGEAIGGAAGDAGRTTASLQESQGQRQAGLFGDVIGGVLGFL